MKAIILASTGSGELGALNEGRPRCLVEVKGRSILDHQIDAFRANGIDDITVVIHPNDGDLQRTGVRIVRSSLEPELDPFLGLFNAGHRLTGEVIVSYGHIVFGPETVAGLRHDHACASLAVDRGWRDVYTGRTEHPIEQAELCETTPGELVLRVGRGLGIHQALGEFIGLVRFSSSLTARLWALYLRALANGLDHPYGDAASLREARLTDIINAAIDRDVLMRAIPIRGGWREIDTVQDLERARSADFW